MFAGPNMLWMVKTNNQNQKLTFLFLSINMLVIIQLRGKLAQILIVFIK